MRQPGYWTALVLAAWVAGCNSGNKEDATATPTAMEAVGATPMYYPFDATPLPGFEAAELTTVEDALGQPESSTTTETAVQEPPPASSEPAAAASSSKSASNTSSTANSVSGGTASQSAQSKTAPPEWTPTQSEMEQALSDYGTWESVPDYGKAWVPSGMAKDWRPYQLGHWVNTPYGWLWEAAEPWGWLPYHYGHWVFVPRVGWAWVPGRTWVPAQVAWRANDAYVAWAPMPPAGIAVAAIRPAAWIVVPVARFLDLTPYRYKLPPSRLPALVPGLPILARTFAVGRATIYHLGPTVPVVRRWVPIVPPPVSIHTWRARVPVRYATHYKRGRARGWYHPPGPPRGQGVHVQTGTMRRGTEVDVHRNPGRGRSVEVEHHNPRRKVDVQVDHRGRHRTVDIDRRGRRRDVEIERRGRHVDVDVSH